MSAVCDETAMGGGQSTADALRELQQRRPQAVELPFSERLEALEGLSTALLRRETGVEPLLQQAGVAFVAGFLQASNLRELVGREIADPGALERYVPVGSRKSLRLLPRGLVAHWLAGNVPLLGVLSWALSALVGNVNVVRLSTRQEDLMSPLLRTLSEQSEAGRQLARETVVLRFPREDTAAHERMSSAADGRVAWGGREAIEMVRSLPARWDCEDVVLGPRISLAVVDPEAVTASALSRLVTDVIYFDQFACSSPQVLFVKGRRSDRPVQRFVDELAREFDNQCSRVRRHPLDFSETYQIELDRARVLLGGGALRRDCETQWTLSFVDEPRSDVRCANRFLQVAPFDDVEELYRYIPANVQTVVTLLTGGDFGTFTEGAARRGVCRFPAPGEGNHFELPWDGAPLVARLLRWVTRTEPSATS